MEFASALAREIVDLWITKMPFAKEEAIIKLRRYELLKTQLLEAGLLVDYSDEPDGGFRLTGCNFNDLPLELKLPLLEIADRWGANPVTVLQEIAAVPQIFATTQSMIEGSVHSAELASTKHHKRIHERLKERQSLETWLYP